jgi:hypothetical protein
MVPEGEARLPTEEQLRLNLRRLIEASIPELAGKIEISLTHSGTLIFLADIGEREPS